MKITTLHTFNTEYSADAIEWCPCEGYLNNFACGTYQLEESTENLDIPMKRKGRIYIFNFKTSLNELIELCRLETAAILDMKWLPQFKHKPSLAVANAVGQIQIFELEYKKLIPRSMLHINPEYNNLLALSLDCNLQQTIASDENEQHILVSDSKGYISLLKYTLENGLEKLNIWSGHNFEAWTCALNKWDSNLALSGGDDTFLHIHDLRLFERVLTNKSHIAGVTSLLSHPSYHNLLLSGSYDERLRSFDIRYMKKPVSEINLGGGIWRIKSDPSARNLILVACMYKNFSLVHFENGNLNDLKLVGEYNEHESICYGADWCLDVEKSEKLFIATCSFYDHKLCVASVEAE
ncbi:diphthine methyltransferase isoform X2 [Teleopsis dalmanni]|nr:diphthine methyltransferase isoform X2 [Teleopsis dalmanni]XP_037952403.1 diphthine methyltransferase isoform X2 [Teleopsis dalmanni]